MTKARASRRAFVMGQRNLTGLRPSPTSRVVVTWGVGGSGRRD